MKRIAGILLIYFLTAISLSAETYYVREVKLELPPLVELLDSFIIPFAKQNYYTYGRSHLEVEFKGDTINVNLVRGIPTFHCYWEDNETADSDRFETGIAFIDGEPVRIRAGAECPYVVKSNSVLRYSVDCDIEFMPFGLYEDCDAWIFENKSDRLILRSVVTFRYGYEYQQQMIPPGFVVE